MKKVLFATSEAVPFIKTGGLADVAGSLPRYFNKDEFDVRVIVPKYMCIEQRWKDKMEYVNHFYMDLSWRQQYVGILQTRYKGITYYFIDNEYYFAGFSPYGYIHEDIEKFAFYSKAVLSCLKVIDFRPDIIHCNDWETALIPVYLKDSFSNDEFYRGIKTVISIHNLKFQGRWDIKKTKDITGLSADFFKPDKLEAYGDANYLKGGIAYSDIIATVSKTYSEEIKTPYFGEGLDGLIKARQGSLYGIINGIDYESYNPLTDPYIPHKYGVSSFKWSRVKNKIKLQEKLGLDVGKNKFLIGIVSRLTEQKGFDLIGAVMDDLCSNQDLQMIVLGTGEEQYENMFRHYEWKYPKQIKACIYFSEELSREMYAASDAFLMPSLFEPCGLSQLISLRYGCVPIVRETGGLKDTVEPYNEYEKTGTGFSFTNYNANDMLSVIYYARSIYIEKKRDWNKIIERGMKKDFSWEKSAKEYEALYNMLTPWL
ncbi:starch synthase [Acetitomaculum ruminis DSM 5522]|uniref:Glycogen synthase n=1 Tax=Acetitomaculum ruminis DSM 5522 TaxID=1120918 RepID=A0A1I0VT04_9FIRM|nr:glycogen synthase GlgA [Acetitomaculum ruminis]SFA79358.1 starch synthase [Acetitomaculum ruminis DSM 5522]